MCLLFIYALISLWFVFIHWNANPKQAGASHPQDLARYLFYGRSSASVCGIKEHECLKGPIIPPCHAVASA